VTGVVEVGAFAPALITPTFRRGDTGQQVDLLTTVALGRHGALTGAWT